ncbi:hypothetical protein P8452_74153 [Trifolium repens]|nr:hypothetical protein P8452_74153 [Trifolium repens]
MIRAVLVMNTQGKPRLAKFYEFWPVEKQQEIIRNVFAVGKYTEKLSHAPVVLDSLVPLNGKHGFLNVVEAFAMMAASLVSLFEFTGTSYAAARYGSATPVSPYIISHGASWVWSEPQTARLDFI